MVVLRAPSNSAGRCNSSLALKGMHGGGTIPPFHGVQDVAWESDPVPATAPCTTIFVISTPVSRLSACNRYTGVPDSLVNVTTKITFKPVSITGVLKIPMVGCEEVPMLTGAPSHVCHRASCEVSASKA